MAKIGIGAMIKAVHVVPARALAVLQLETDTLLPQQMATRAFLLPLCLSSCIAATATPAEPADVVGLLNVTALYDCSSSWTECNLIATGTNPA